MGIHGIHRVKGLIKYCKQVCSKVMYHFFRYKFDEFSDHDFCYLHLCGSLQGIIFIERPKRFEGGVLGSLSIDLMGFWTIRFFHLQLWGRVQGVVFTYDP